jgi:uncharacterized protein (TIGR03086 family)
VSIVADRYRVRADAFERKVAATRPEQWANQSPCTDWTARDVVGHIVDMHAAMLSPLGRTLSPAPTVAEDPLAAFRAARADVEGLLVDPEAAGTECDTPGGRVTFAEHVDQVVSEDMVMHGWDLASATGQDARIDPDEVERMWAKTRQMPADLIAMFRTPEAFGPGVVVFGPEVEVPEDAPTQDRLLGFFGRNPRFGKEGDPVNASRITGSPS